MKLTEDMTIYQREWSRKNRNGDPDYAEKRRQYRLANYERVREQEKRSKEKRREIDRAHNREAMRRKRAENPELMRALSRQSDHKSKYGITLEQKQEIFVAQGSCCAICGTTDNRGKEWHTDHCHSTKKVRGVLCNYCNLMLGHAKDNPNTLARAIAYLKRTIGEP